MNKKIIWGIVVVIIVIGLGYWSKGTKISEKSVKVGVILPLSGDFGVIGKELQRGVELAADQLKTEGINIVPVYEDDKFDLKEVVTASNKLITVDKVDFATLFSVTEAKPVVSIFNNNKIPLVVLWDSNSFLKEAGPYIFSNGFSTEKAGEVMADFAYNKLGLKKVAILRHIEGWSEIITKAFEDQYIKNGGQVVFSDAVQVGTNDFRLIISKIKNAKPDVIYAPLIPFDSVSYLKQASEAGLKTVTMSGDVFIQDVVDALGPAADNVYYTNAHFNYPELGNQYKQAYGADPYGLFYAAAGYDMIMNVGRGLKQDEDIKISFDKFFGPTRTIEKVEKIYQVKSGVSTEVE